MTVRPWLIWSNEHNGWWGNNRSGYTQNIDHAGRYTSKEAIQIVMDANKFIPAHKLPHEVLTPAPETIALVDKLTAMMQ